MGIVRKFVDLGIAAKLTIVFLVFGAIPMGAVGLIAYGSTEDMKESIGLQFLSESKSLADTIDRNLFERYGDVQVFGFNDAITRGTQWYDSTESNGISQVMNKYVQAYGIYDLTLLVDLKGDLIAANFKNAKGELINTQFLFKQNFAETPWFRALAKGSFTVKQRFTSPGNDLSTGTFIEDIHIDTDVKKALGKDGYVMGFSSPVYDESGRVIAYWSNRANFTVIENMVQDSYRKLKDMGFPSAEITLIDDGGRVILDYDPTSKNTEDIVRDFDVLLTLNLMEKNVPIAQKVIEGKSGFEVAMHARKNISQVGAYTHLHGALGYPGMNWGVLIRVSEKEAVAGPIAAQTKVLFTGLICLGLVLPLGWWIGYRGSRQIKNIQNLAEQVAGGNYGNRLSVLSKDEIGRLTSSINTMANVLQDNALQVAAMGKTTAIIEFKMDGRILTANDAFCQCLGYSLEEITDKHHRMFVDPGYANSSEYEAFWGKLNRGEFNAGVYRRLGKGGKEVWIQASYNPIMDATGKPCKVMKFATDITVQKQATAEMERAMQETRSVLGAMEEGNLSRKMEQDYQGEFLLLKNSLNTAITKLVGVVQAVREGAVSVQTASEEITKGNEDLSERTSAQAGALEETSASMEEMTSTIKQNADNAKQANQLAVAAREVAEKGGTVTEKAVEAMSEINKSSKKIADIINVIDEIAFQTNLLALNAAVEAARAGEQGRGFAVVASEVRNLAQRSATAAKEIKNLINESVQKVGDGSELVNQSGQTLSEIVNSVKRVTDIIAEISAASQEQASGIDQVNKAVMQMDEGTQQNAALVEEATTASQSMRQQADELLREVGFFKLEEEGQSHSLSNSSSYGSGSAPHSSCQKPSTLEDQKVPSVKGSSTKSSMKPRPVGVGSSKSNGYKKSKDDFFEEF